MSSRTLKGLNMSTKTLCLPLLLIILFNHTLLSKGSSHMLEGGKHNRKEIPIKTITVHDGDIYDCMKLHNQYRMKDPLIKRKIQLRENSSLQGTITTTNSSDHESASSKKLRKTRSLGNESCPPGSFPVLKATKAGPLNFSAIEDFSSLRARSFLRSKTTKPLVDNDASVREYAQASVKGRYGGAEGTLSVWRPTLEHNSEMSLSQIWVLSETSNDLSMSLEAGWMVNPSLYGDTRTRFFIFTTNDEYNTWLYNDNRRSQPPNNRLQFTRVNNDMPFGMRLDCSTIDGDNTEIEIVIKQDEDQDWGLWVDETMIGYWPKSNYRARRANKVIWGGEVVNRRTRGRHTSTQMGNGHFSSEPIGRVAYISNMALYDLHLNRYDAPQAINVDADDPDCYDLRYWQSDEEYGQHITFGGPGYDRVQCP
ncbi:hypothetical protein EJ110_NYTH32404 [Nymphaea thermarum]|nr:hypothetical protein EJ110_NYTH32404 [Nymphaea thermarum]